MTIWRGATLILNDGSAISGFDPGATQLLLEHPWPGNVRELDHAVERGVLLAQGQLVRSADLGLRTGSAGGGDPGNVVLESSLTPATVARVAWPAPFLGTDVVTGLFSGGEAMIDREKKQCDESRRAARGALVR